MQKQKKILTVVGNRPQFIKACLLCKEFKNYPNIKEIILHTGQHYSKNMSQQFFSELKIPKPKYNLNINKTSHGNMTGRMIKKIEEVLMIERPELIIVFGDTNSTLAASLAGAKLNIPIAHVESGLRSYNMTMPEEVNRRVSDHVSKWLFTPSMIAKNNLIKEGFPKSNIFMYGDVMYDSLIFFSKISDLYSNILEKLKLNHKKYYLVTIHREENTNIKYKIIAIIDLLINLSKKNTIVWPIHPRTLNLLKKLKLLKRIKQNIILIPPQGYIDFIRLEKSAKLIITDSGGVQKESFLLKVPCVIMRNETEWPEPIKLGWSKLIQVRTGSEIIKKFNRLKFKKSKNNFPYGKGDAVKKIAALLSK